MTSSPSADSPGPEPSVPPGVGNPRLLFSFGGETSTGAPQREFPLLARVTTIGSAPEADLCLAGLDLRHAEIRHDEDDDYTYVRLGVPGGPASLDPVQRAVLRTGTRLVFGSWAVSFQREEFADSSVATETSAGQAFASMRDEARAAASEEPAAQETEGA